MSAGDDPATRLRELLTRVVEACAVSGSVEVSEDEESLRATIRGDDLGLLIGRHGQTIDALQHLAFRVAYRDTEPRKRVIVDAAGYRDRRAAVLHRQADRAVTEAARFGRPVALEAMSAAERRLVHEYLRDRAEIETYSEGEEPHRHLVVAPVVS
ncbi:MAG: protein jag [Solirubrobacteraceae bacterium]